MSSADPLSLLVVRHEIEAVLARYARALDRIDGEALSRCFHSDAKVSIGGEDLALVKFESVVVDLLRELRSTHHQLGNVAIELAGDVAHVETYFTAVHRIGADGWSPYPQAKPEEDLTMRGRYVDRFERRGGVWAIVHRALIVDWARFDPSDDRGIVPPTLEPRSRRHRDDGKALR